MSKLAFVLLPFFALCSGLLRAQDAPIPPPTPPFVKTPPPGLAWAVKIEQADASKKKKEEKTGASTASTAPKKQPEMPVQLAVKIGRNGVVEGQISYNDNRQETYYVSEGSLIVLAENTGKAFPRSLQMSEDDAFSLEVAHFPGTSWITLSKYKGVEKTDGVACWHYAMVQKNQDGDLKLDAWIRSDTGYPAEIKLTEPVMGSFTYHFEPVTAFPDDVQLPDTCRNALVQLKKLQSALDALRKANQAQQ